MASMAAKMVSAFCGTQGIVIQQVEEDLLAGGFEFNGGSLKIFCHFDETDTHVHLEGVGFIKVPQDKYDVLYKVLNECNDKYTHVKFVLDTEEGQLNARDDAVIRLDSCGEECFELMIRMVKVVEDAYPKFMKAIWS